jgi:hypothetical protein
MLAACSSTEIENKTLDDRVKACSAGFSIETQAALNASVQKAQLKGDIGGDMREETKAVIFSQMPDQYKLKAYEDYIGCIEKNWNKND